MAERYLSSRSFFTRDLSSTVPIAGAVGQRVVHLKACLRHSSVLRLLAVPSIHRVGPLKPFWGL